jgi:hypothetical protein
MSQQSTPSPHSLPSTVTYNDAASDAETEEPVDISDVQSNMITLVLMQRRGTLPSEAIDIVDSFLGTRQYDRRWVHPVSGNNITDLVQHCDGCWHSNFYAFGKGWVLGHDCWNELVTQCNPLMMTASCWQQMVRELLLH